MTYLVYIDESKDAKAGICIFSALAVPSEHWYEALEKLRAFRREIKERDTIYVRKELHACIFTAGRGRPSQANVSRTRRCEIFREKLNLIAGMRGAMLFNSVSRNPEYCLERLLNRVNKTVESRETHAVFIFDDGDSIAIQKMMRKMRKFNHIPSKFGYWRDVRNTTKNVPILRALEDPFFRDSQESYFIQAVDFCAYALMQKERPIESKIALGLDTAFELLQPICCREAHPEDPYGIIRDKGK